MTYIVEVEVYYVAANQHLARLRRIWCLVERDGGDELHDTTNDHTTHEDSLPA